MSTYSKRPHRLQATAPQPQQVRTHCSHRARSHWPHAALPSTARTHDEQATGATLDGSAGRGGPRSLRCWGRGVPTSLSPPHLSLDPLKPPPPHCALCHQRSPSTGVAVAGCPGAPSSPRHGWAVLNTHPAAFCLLLHLTVPPASHLSISQPLRQPSSARWTPGPGTPSVAPRKGGRCWDMSQAGSDCSTCPTLHKQH